MTGTKTVACSKCGKELFYMPDGYKMAMKVICMECGDKKSKAKKTKTVRTASCNFARTKKGVRKDVHPTYNFKSATEANFARILTELGLQWKYEERSFVFNGYKTKPFVYIMDFEIIPASNIKGIPCQYIEVKGYMDARSRNKLRRLKKCYPEEAKQTLIIIYNKSKKKDIEFCDKLGFRYLFFDELTKEFESKIITWE